MRPEFQQAVSVFTSEIDRCRDLVGLADNLAPQAPALDLDDLYRQSLTAAVSALDTHVHSIVRTGIILHLQGIGPVIAAQLPVSADLFRRWYAHDFSALNEIELAIRLAHARWTMQFSKDIAEAVRLVSSRPLWVSISGNDTNLAAHLKTSLDVVVRRRNQIAHESDLDPSTGKKWPIGSALVLSAIKLVKDRGESIANHVASEY